METNHESRNPEKRSGKENETVRNENVTGTGKIHSRPEIHPEDDPAIINPDELATFPREVKNQNPDLDDERESHAVNLKSSPVREGRNITNTDTKPDENGFM